MHVERLSVPGSFVFTPKVFSDNRGAFLEWFRQETLAAELGHPLQLTQANWSTSRRGVIRGVHYADTPPGQAKYIFCVAGAVLDVVVDLRVGSATFGEHHAVRLDGAQPRAVYVSEGLGHGFCALTDEATVLYLCSTGYDPTVEHGLHPLDPDLALPWPDGVEPVLSAKDATAPSLAEAIAAGTLPTLEECESWASHLRLEAAAGRALGPPGQPAVQGARP